MWTYMHNPGFWSSRTSKFGTCYQPVWRTPGNRSLAWGDETQALVVI